MNYGDQPLIYAIVNKIDGKRYVGSAVNFCSRSCRHKQLLRENRHHSPYLQNAWNLYGEDAFDFQVIELTTKDKTLEREQYWIDFYKSADHTHGYNMCPHADSWLGMHHSEKTRRILSEKRKGKRMTEGHRRIMSEANKGPLPEWRRKKRIGSGNSNAKLTEQDVVRIKQLLASGTKVRPIATEYGVTYNAIWEIKKGIKWTQVSI